MTTTEDVERAKRQAVRSDVVTVRWVCRRVLEHLKRGREFLPVRCSRTFTDTSTRSDLEARQAHSRCPSCGGMLTQRADGCELVSDPKFMMQAK